MAPPRGPAAEFNDVDLWIDLAKTLEEGLFDAMFFADVTGLYGPADGQYVDNVHEGLQIPSNDPAVLLGALAVATKDIGLAYTSNVMQNHPFNFARQVSTLDHISKGRIAWNIVTSTQENAARNFGFDALAEHDARYDWADEYLDVAYKLWEGSWDEGALLVDKEGGRYCGSVEDPQDQPRGRALQGGGTAPALALAAAHPVAFPGRRLAARHPPSLPARRGRVHRPAQPGGGPAAHQNARAAGGRGRTRARRTSSSSRASVHRRRHDAEVARKRAGLRASIPRSWAT